MLAFPTSSNCWFLSGVFVGYVMSSNPCKIRAALSLKPELGYLDPQTLPKSILSISDGNSVPGDRTRFYDVTVKYVTHHVKGFHQCIMLLFFFS